MMPLPYTPADWFWIVGGDKSRAWSSAAAAFVPSWDAQRTTRIPSLVDLDGVLRQNALPSPIITASDVRAECQNRIVRLVGASSLDACIIKQLNALMRATELVNKKSLGETLSETELAEEAALSALAVRIKQLRAFSNVMEPSPPADYADDRHWVSP